MKLHIFGIALALAAGFGSSVATAALPEPSNWIFGSIIISNVPAGADRTDLVVEARRTVNGPAVASYRMGDTAQYGDMYFLELPIESSPVNRVRNAFTNGTSLVITLRDETAVLAQNNYVIPDKGRFLRMDFVIGPVAPPSQFDQWRTANSIAGNGSGDRDGDGFSDLREYVAGSNPNNPGDNFKLNIRTTQPATTVSFVARRAEGTGYTGLTRLYSLEFSTNAALTGPWFGVPSFTNVTGNNQSVTYQQPSTSRPIYYRGRVWLQ
jgi:hypothetical protein